MPRLVLTKIDRDSQPPIQPVAEHRRSFDFPASDEMLDSMEPDQDMIVVLRGTVKEVRKVSEDAEFGSNSFELEVVEIEAYPPEQKSEFEILAEDD